MQINRHTYENIFLLYVDGELGEEERRAVEEFARTQPGMQEELDLLKETVAVADDEIVFDDKSSLYKKERETTAFPWFKLAAAAVILAILGTTGWIFATKDNDRPNHSPVAAVKKPFRPENSEDRVYGDKSKPGEEQVKDVEQKPTLSSVEKKSSGERRSPAVSAERVNSSKEINKTSDPSAEKNSSVSDDDAAPATELKPREFSADIVEVSPGAGEVDIPVQPRILDNMEPSSTTQTAAYRSDDYNEPPKAYVISFGNAEISRTQKLRGVLRKASRFLDRVTTSSE